MTYSLLVPVYLAWVVKFVADIENYMNAVERILEYSQLEAEDGADCACACACACAEGGRGGDCACARAAAELESEGKAEVRFETAGLAHGREARCVVQGATLAIPAGQRVAVVGRSGSGKSTLLMGLSRVARLLHGRITVGGRDVAALPLRRLRRMVWTVPQDVSLLSGTVRSNLDPEGDADGGDAALAAALASLGLAGDGKDSGLGAEVAEGGDNLGHGRRQVRAVEGRGGAGRGGAGRGGRRVFLVQLLFEKNDC